MVKLPTRCNRLLFDYGSAVQDYLTPIEVDVGLGRVVQTLMLALEVIVVDELR